MKGNHFAKLGWLVAALSFGLLAAAGFQGGNDKTGTVDLQKVIDQSDRGKTTQGTFNTMVAARQQLIDFCISNRVVTIEQSTKLRDLWLKLPQSDAEKGEIEKTKNDIMASDRKLKELQTKPNATEADRQLLDELTRRSQVMAQTVERWRQEFSNEMQTWLDKENQAIIEKAKAALQETAKGQGYSMVLESKIAPFCVNDLTDATIKAMNAKK